MEGKYPKVARAKQSQKFADKLIERWRQLLNPVQSCEKGIVWFPSVSLCHDPCNVRFSAFSMRERTHPFCAAEGV